MNKIIKKMMIGLLTLASSAALFAGCNAQDGYKLQYDTNELNQKNPIDSWMSFVEGRGKYDDQGTTVKLIENETDKEKDNWPNYDFYATKNKHTNFSFETVIKVDKAEMDALNALPEDMRIHPKFGLRVWKDESSFFTVFLIPGNTGLPISMLSMYDGGWAQLWTAPNAPDYVQPEQLDLVENGVKLKIERNNQILKIYYNDVLIHTEEGFRVAYNEQLKIGFTSERINNVTYSNVAINEIEFEKIDLKVPKVKMDGNILSYNIVPYAEKYQLKVGEQIFDITESKFNLYNFLKENNIAKGEYQISVRALADTTRFNEGEYSESITFNFNPDGVQLFAPEFEIKDNKLVFTADSNATDYILKVSLADVVLHEVAGVTENYDLTQILSNMKVDEDYKFELMAKGDGNKITDSDWNSVIYKGKSNWLSKKGYYVGTENSVTLVKQETLDVDNYGTGYDVVYMDATSANFEFSADISLTKDSHIGPLAKYGIKVGVSESSYFTVFITPLSNEIVLLSTLDGGSSWVQIWTGKYPTNIEDYTIAHNLKVVRTEGVIEVFFNDALIHTEDNYAVGADERLNIGFTSEMISDIHYDNVTLVDRSSVWIPTKGEYKEGKDSITLVTQATTDGDNYGAGYDLAYHNTKLANFIYSADIAITESSHMSPGVKYGLKVGVSETSYFTAFICPNLNSIVLLSTVDGGTSWVQLWGGNFATNTIDYTKALNLKLTRKDGVIEVYLNDVLIHTENNFTVGADTPLNLGVTSEGVNDLHYTNIVVKDASTWKSTKGEYVEKDGNLTLVTQATTDEDNYGAGYDRAYLSGAHVNFEYSADIALTKDSHISSAAKYGLKIGVSETSYFSVFICPKLNSIVLLSTLDGGANWVQLWSGNFETNTTDYTKALNIKLARNNDVIELYLNNELIHTEKGYAVGAETSLTLGVTSEGVNDLHYTNIVVKDL